MPCIPVRIKISNGFGTLLCSTLRHRRFRDRLHCRPFASSACWHRRRVSGSVGGQELLGQTLPPPAAGVSSSALEVLAIRSDGRVRSSLRIESFGKSGFPIQPSCSIVRVSRGTCTSPVRWFASPAQDRVLEAVSGSKVHVHCCCEAYIWILGVCMG